MTNIFKTIWDNPWYLMISFLSILVIIALFNFDPVKIATHTLASLITAVLTDLVIRRMKFKQWGYPIGATVSGLIIAIGLPFTVPIYIPIFTAFIAMMLKNVIRVSGKNVFNPANLGLLVTGLIFNSGIAWWGVIIPWVMLLFSITIYKVRRYPVLLSFLVLYSLLLLVFKLSFNFSLLYSELLGFLFWAPVMLVEPISSPATTKRQIIFGSLAALGVFGFGYLIPAYALLAGLAAADVFVPLLNRFVN